MTLLRSIIYLIFLGASTVVYALKIVIFAPWLSFEARSKIANCWGSANLYALKLLCRLDYQITGLENVPEKNCIIMANHQSIWETIALRSIIAPPQTWILKRELLALPFFGWALQALQPIAIDRAAGSKALRQVIAQGTDALKQGRWIILFPEGTRVTLGIKQKYNIGGAMLAEKSGFSILPIAHNAGVFWPRQGIKKMPGTIQVIIGPVINTSGKTSTQINNEIETWIRTQVEQLLNPIQTANTSPHQSQ